MTIGRIPSVEGGIQPTIVDAKGDLIAGVAADSVNRLAVGTNEHRLVADSGQTTGLKYVADTTNYAIAAKGDLLAGTAADTVAALGVGANGTVLTADSGETTGMKWATSAVGANWTLLNSGGTALTGATTITVSGISNVDKIMVVIDRASSANAESIISVRFNGDTANNYFPVGIRVQASTTYNAANFVAEEGPNQSSIRIAKLANTGTSRASGYLLMSGCNSSGVKVFNSAGNASPVNDTQQFCVLGGYYDSASTISSVSLVSSTGNFDNGSIFIYASA